MRLNWSQPPIVDPANVAITGGNVYFANAKSAVPFIKPSSHTMGNNGAISGLTALRRTYSQGAWMWMATGHIAAASVAGWYWFVGSSTTAGTLFNSTYTSGVPGVGTQTAFVTTGPGANTGVTVEVFGPTLTIPILGTMGSFRTSYAGTQTSNANSKIYRQHWSGSGGTIIASQDAASQANVASITLTANQGVTNVQVTNTISGAYVAGLGVIDSVIDTSAATSLVLSLQGAVATDNMVIEQFTNEVATP